MTARLFTDYLREIDKGRLNEILSGEMQALVEAVHATDKKGSITLKIELEPKGEDTVVLTTKVDAKVPKEGAKPSLFFIDEDSFNLTRRDPRQMDMEDTLRPINGNGGPSGDRS